MKFLYSGSTYGCCIDTVFKVLQLKSLVDVDYVLEKLKVITVDAVLEDLLVAR